MNNTQISIDDIERARKILDEQPIPLDTIKGYLTDKEFKEWKLLEYVNRRMKASKALYV